MTTTGNPYAVTTNVLPYLIDQLAALVSSADPIAKIHTYMSRAVDPDIFMDAFLIEREDGKKEVRCWEIFLEHIRVERSGSGSPPVPLGFMHMHHSFKINGWLSYVEGQSDVRFRSMVDAVLKRLGSRIRIESTTRTLPPEADFRGIVNKSRTLAHAVAITYTLVEVVGIT